MKEEKNDSTSVLSRFGRDKRKRTVVATVERVERRPRLQRDAADSDQPSDDRKPAERASYNPHFTADNRPAFEKPHRDYDHPRSNEDRPHRNFGDKPRYDRDDKPTYHRYDNDDRPHFNRNNGDERPRYNRYNNDEKPHVDRFNRDDRPRFTRNDDDDSRFNRVDYDENNQDRPYGNKPRNSYGDRKFGPKKFGDKPYGDKPYGDKPYGDRKFGPKKFGDKPYGDKPYGDRKFGDKKFGDKKFGDKKFGPKKFGDKSFKPSFRKSDAPMADYPKFNPEKQTGAIRLNRFLAQSGICSRREADDFIVAGVVSVNGKIVTELGTKVMPDDEVKFNDSRVQGEKKVYLVLNKPKGYVTSLDDPHAGKTVMELVKDACTERIYPVGRLDKNSLGLLLFTNDGDLTKQLTHPTYMKKKIYQVTLDKPLTRADMDRIAEGVTLEDGEIFADEISYVKEEDKKEIGIEIHSGRNRIVRRIFEFLGYSVTKLDRVYYAGLTKKNLKRGAWRFLSREEVERLKSGQYE